jgi:hypothetical protein
MGELDHILPLLQECEKTAVDWFDALDKKDTAWLDEALFLLNEG